MGSGGWTRDLCGTPNVSRHIRHVVETIILVSSSVTVKNRCNFGSHVAGNVLRYSFLTVSHGGSGLVGAGGM